MRKSLFAALITVTVLIGCSSPKEYVFKPLEEVSLAFSLYRVKYMSDTKSVFVRYELTLTNIGTTEISFDPGDIKIRINGLENEFTYYDSIGSVMTESQVYAPGSTVFNLYSVFPEELKGLKIKDIKTVSLESSGLEGSP